MNTIEPNVQSEIETPGTSSFILLMNPMPSKIPPSINKQIVTQKVFLRLKGTWNFSLTSLKSLPDSWVFCFRSSNEFFI